MPDERTQGPSYWQLIISSKVTSQTLIDNFPFGWPNGNIISPEAPCFSLGELLIKVCASRASGRQSPRATKWQSKTGLPDGSCTDCHIFDISVMASLVTVMTFVTVMTSLSLSWHLWHNCHDICDWYDFFVITGMTSLSLVWHLWHHSWHLCHFHDIWHVMTSLSLSWNLWQHCHNVCHYQDIFDINAMTSLTYTVMICSDIQSWHFWRTLLWHLWHNCLDIPVTYDISDVHCHGILDITVMTCMTHCALAYSLRTISKHKEALNVSFLF